MTQCTMYIVASTAAETPTSTMSSVAMPNPALAIGIDLDIKTPVQFGTTMPCPPAPRRGFRQQYNYDLKKWVYVPKEVPTN